MRIIHNGTISPPDSEHKNKDIWRSFQEVGWDEEYVECYTPLFPIEEDENVNCVIGTKYMTLRPMDGTVKNLVGDEIGTDDMDCEVLGHRGNLYTKGGCVVFPTKTERNWAHFNKDDYERNRYGIMTRKNA